MKNYYILFFLLAFCRTMTMAQEEFNQLIWKNEITNDANTQLEQVLELSTGSLAVLTTGEDENSVLTIIKRTGEIMKELSFDKRKSKLVNMLELSTGNIALVGYTDKGKEGRDNGWLVLSSPMGEVIWEKEYGGEKDDVFSRIAEVDEDYFLVGGTTKSGSNERGNVWLLKINLEGSVVWERENGTENRDDVHAIIPVNNGFIVAGHSEKGSNEHAFLLNINLEGNEIWKQNLSEGTNLFNGVKTFDDKLVFVGYQFNAIKDILVLKISPENGNIIWENTQESVIGEDLALDIEELIDGRLMLIGKSFSYSVGASFPKIFYQTIQSSDGLMKQKPVFFEMKKDDEGVGTFIQYADNRDLMIAGMWGGKPFVSRYQTVSKEKPVIKWVKNFSEKVKDVTIGEDEEAFLDIEASIISPVLIKKEDIRVYWNKKIQTNPKYYKNLVLGKPYKSTDNNNQFVYKVLNKIAITKEDSIVEIRLYNNLFSVQSEEYAFKLHTNFDLDMLWLSHQEANFSNPLPKMVADNNMTVKLMIECTEPLDKNNFEILVNGKKTEGAKYSETVIDPRAALKKEREKKENEKYEYIYMNNVYLKKGENRISLRVRTKGKEYESKELHRVYNGEATVAGYLEVDTTFSKNLTNLYVLSVGVKHNDLKYTVQDAEDIGAAFKTLENKGLFKNVYVETIAGDAANKTEIDIAMERYKNAYRIGEITNKDLFVVFISSHGFIYQDSIAGVNDWIKFEKFLIQASNFNNAAKEATSVAYETIISTLAAIRCKKLVLIDACFSGGAQRNTNFNTSANESINNLITQLSFQQPGLVTITSSTKSQPSYEDAAWENGAFTEAIIESFKSGDVNGDKIVTLSEMYAFIAKRIPQLVNQVKEQDQRPTITTSKMGNVPIFEMD